jgi:hypothetical protein
MKSGLNGIHIGHALGAGEWTSHGENEALRAKQFIQSSRQVVAAANRDHSKYHG